jgi:hypothetical protein
MVDLIPPDVDKLTPIHICSLGIRKERHSGGIWTGKNNLSQFLSMIFRGLAFNLRFGSTLGSSGRDRLTLTEFENTLPFRVWACQQLQRFISTISLWFSTLTRHVRSRCVCAFLRLSNLDSTRIYLVSPPQEHFTGPQ